MGTTPLLALPYADASSQPAGHLQQKALAEAVDAELEITCTSSTRPPHKVNRRIWETDTGRHYRSNGTVWNLTQGQMVSGTAMFGTYAGEPLYTIGDFDQGTLASSILTVSFAARAPGVRGLMNVTANSPDSVGRHVRPIHPAVSATTFQVVLRDVVGGAGSSGTASIVWQALVW